MSAKNHSDFIYDRAEAFLTDPNDRPTPYLVTSCEATDSGAQSRVGREDVGSNPTDSLVYVIHSQSDDGFWSNDTGWGSLQGATVFTQDQARSASLPTSINNDAAWYLCHQSQSGHITLVAQEDLDSIDPVYAKAGRTRP